MLTLKRFNLGLTFADFNDHGITLPLLVADGRQVVVDTIDATPTHDGYFVAAVPVGAALFTIALRFGKLYDLVEVHSVQFRQVAALLNTPMAPGSDVVAATPTFEGMDVVAPRIYRCGDPDGFMMVPPPGSGYPRGLVLEVVFRPLAKRVPALTAASIAPIEEALV